jgi:glycosyltransferase involved in cell wall biosynthesis
VRVAFFGGYDAAYPRVRVFREGLESQGVEVVEFGARPDGSSLPRLFGPLGGWIARGRGVDALVVPAFGHRDVSLAAALGRLAGIPVLFDPLVSRWDTQVGDLGRVRAGGFTAARLEWSDRWSLRAADLVLCDTWEHADLFGTRFGVPRAKLARVPVGADRATFARGAAREGTGDRPAGAPLDVVYVGGFLPLHGMETIVRAAALLESARGPEFARFTLIGGGMLAHRTARDAAAAGLRSLRQTRPMPNERAIDRLASADVSLGIFGVGEKAGRVVPHKVFQSMALAVPTVTRRSGAIAEFFRDREHLALVPGGDAPALAAALEALAGDRAARERMGCAGRTAALEAGHPDRIGALLVDAVRRARDRTAPGSRR